MQITTTKASLVPSLALVSGAADTKGTVPMLGMVLLKAVEGKLSMLCSDTTVLARAMSSCDVTAMGEIAVDVRRFSDLIRAVPDKQAIQMTVDSKGLQIKAGRSRFKLPTLSAADYPRMIPETAERISVTMDSGRLAAMVDDISLSMASADVRVFLNGGLFRIDEKGLWLVSTDGNRLVVSHEPIKALENVTPREVIVPRKTVILAKKILLGQEGQVKLTIGASDFQLSFPDSTVLLCKSIVGAFPDWRKVIPKPERDFVMETQRLSDSLSMITAMNDAADTKNGLRDKVELVVAHKLLTIQKGDAARCEVDTGSDCTDSTEFNVNITYLTDAAAIMRGKFDEIRIGYSASAPMTPITLRPKDADYPLAVVMPMRG